jgi:hypothetical protein
MEKTLVTDRSAITTDWDCRMKYYWSRHAEGQGIVPVEEPHYFIDGRKFAESLEDIRTPGFKLDSWVEEQVNRLPTTMTVRAQESLLRLTGMMIAYKTFIEPKILKQFEIVDMEKELILDRSPLWIATTPDLIKRDRKSGKLVYQDDKSVTNASNQWTAHWNYAIQLHIGLAAMEEEYGEEVAYAHIMGLRKGQYSYGALSHPYVYVHRSPQGKWQRRGYKGWEKLFASEYPGGIEAWVNELGADTASELFPWSVPVFLNRRLLDGMVADRLLRMTEIDKTISICGAESLEAQRLFPKSLNQCYPSMGSMCPYLQACHNQIVGDDPLASGLYQRRVPHHEVEILHRNVNHLMEEVTHEE